MFSIVIVKLPEESDQKLLEPPSREHDARGIRVAESAISSLICATNGVKKNLDSDVGGTIN
jgi:hypothetical protein